LRFSYGYCHQFLQLRFMLLVHAHAGHTSRGALAPVCLTKRGPRDFQTELEA
jgi:hypothetical protein